MSKRVREKCRKLCIFSILHSKRGITPTKITQIDNTLTWSENSKTKSYAKFQLNMSKHVREKCGKLWFSSILSSKRGITPTKINANWRHSNLICSTVKQSEMQNFSSISQSVWGEKCGKLCIFSILHSKRGLTTTKIHGNWWHSNLICSTVKQSHMQFQLNMSKHVGEKCGKLQITYILSSQRGITPTKIDAKWRHSHLICSTLKKVMCKISDQYVKACMRKVRKTGGRRPGRRVGRTDITIP